MELLLVVLLISVNSQINQYFKKQFIFSFCFSLPISIMFCLAVFMFRSIHDYDVIGISQSSQVILILKCFEMHSGFGALF